MAEPSHDPAVSCEPHLRGGGFALDPSEDTAARNLSRRRPDREAEVAHSVWDEPALSESLSGPAPDGAVTYAGWLATETAAMTPWRSWRHVLLLISGSGLWAVAGVFILTLQGQGGGLGLAAVVVFGPVLEELLKISTALITVERRPWLFLSSGQIYLCCVTSGLMFAAVENLLYLLVYIRDPTWLLVVWRWTVCVLLHAGCSGIAAVGLVRVWREALAQRRRPELAGMTRSVAIACLIHGVYNLVATLLDPWLRLVGEQLP